MNIVYRTDSHMEVPQWTFKNELFGCNKIGFLYGFAGTNYINKRSAHLACNRLQLSIKHKLVASTVVYILDMNRSETSIKSPRSKGKQILTLLLAFLFIAAGIFHFLTPKPYLKIMPSYLAYHLELVYLSGLFEILGGVGVLVPRMRRYAGYGLIALLVAVFPANINMAVQSSEFESIPAYILWLRLPLQLVFIAWVWFCTIKKRL